MEQIQEDIAVIDDIFDSSKSGNVIYSLNNETLQGFVNICGVSF